MELAKKLEIRVCEYEIPGTRLFCETSDWMPQGATGLLVAAISPNTMQTLRHCDRSDIPRRAGNGNCWPAGYTIMLPETEKGLNANGTGMVLIMSAITHISANSQICLEINSLRSYRIL